VGKGIIASSVCLPIRSMALKLTDIKIEPTINLDVATLSLTE
jgi:CTP synthase (UTP-ammonia lyase)